MESGGTATARRAPITLHHDSGAKQHAEDGQEFEAAQQPGNIPDPPVDPGHVPERMWVAVSGRGHRVRLNVQHQDAQDRHAAQDVQGYDAFRLRGGVQGLDIIG
jgi:hypothetical protein